MNPSVDIVVSVILIIPSTKTECDYLNGWIKKTVTYAKISPKSGDPQRYCWGTQNKQTKNLIMIIISVIEIIALFVIFIISLSRSGYDNYISLSTG